MLKARQLRGSNVEFGCAGDSGLEGCQLRGTGNSQNSMLRR